MFAFGQDVDLNSEILQILLLLYFADFCCCRRPVLNVLRLLQQRYSEWTEELNEFGSQTRKHDTDLIDFAECTIAQFADYSPVVFRILILAYVVAHLFPLGVCRRGVDPLEDLVKPFQNRSHSWDPGLGLSDNRTTRSVRCVRIETRDRQQQSICLCWHYVCRDRVLIDVGMH